jgi:hypothetical protein
VRNPISLVVEGDYLEESVCYGVGGIGWERGDEVFESRLYNRGIVFDIPMRLFHEIGRHWIAVVRGVQPIFRIFLFKLELDEMFYFLY